MFCTNCGASNSATAKFCFQCGFRLNDPASFTPVAASTVPAGGVTRSEAAAQYATVGQRALAFLIDWLIITGAQAVVVVLALLTTESGADGDLNAFLWLVNVAGAWLYYAGMESSAHQGTFGKKKVGIAVVDLRGHRVSFLRASARWVGKFLSALPLGLGLLMAAFTQRRQALHDLMAGSVVIRTPPATPASPEAIGIKRGAALSTSRITGLSVSGLVMILIAVILWPSATSKSTTTGPSRTSFSDYKQSPGELRPPTSAAVAPTPQNDAESLSKESTSMQEFLGMKRGLAGVHQVVLVVNFVATSAETVLRNNSIAGDTVETRLGLRLRQAGIRVLDRPPANVTTPLLLVSIGAGCLERIVCNVDFSLILVQRATLYRDSSIEGWYGTWIDSDGLIAGIKAFPAAFWPKFDTLSDHFINDWLAENPRIH